MNTDSAGRPDVPREPWPELPLGPWSDTYQTLHMWTQIVGKTRLAMAPKVNHWWHVPLYVSARGLTTSRVPYGTAGFEVAFDFVADELTVVTDGGARWSTPLAPRTVAEFYHEYTGGLRSLGLDVRIWPHPVEVPVAVPFDEDEVHGAYDADAAHRFWHALSHAHRLLEEFRGGFLGKCSPVHFFWGSFDLACTRFSGRRAPEHPGGIPNLADWVTREAYSHECISAGWWPGTVDGAVSEPAFYAYAYPEPPGCPEAPIEPAEARYEWAMREWVLPYAAARASVDADGTVRSFLRSTYSVAAGLGRWARADLELQEGSSPGG